MKETKDSQEYFNNISNLKYSKLKKYQVDEGKLSSSLSSTINNNINNNNNNNNSYSSEQLQINKLEQEAEKKRKSQINNNKYYSFHVFLPFLPLFIFCFVFNNSTSSNESWLQSFRLAVSLCGALVTSHTCTVSYIAWRDLTGQWKKYSLIKNRKPTVELYLNGYKKFLFDISLMLLPAMTVVCHFRFDAVMNATLDDPAWKGFLKQFIGYNIGELWVAGAHKIMHHPYIYAAVHKRHHCAIKELVASAAWLDTTTEFLVAEIPALLMALMILPTNPFWHHLFFAYQGLGAASDHAGFSFDDEEDGGIIHWIHQNFFDGEYHYLHHLNPSVNYAEEEWIDYLFGTHHTYTKWWSRRLKREEREEQQRRKEEEEEEKQLLSLQQEERLMKTTKK